MFIIFDEVGKQKNVTEYWIHMVKKYRYIA